jgi:hypothetical protein
LSGGNLTGLRTRSSWQRGSSKASELGMVTGLFRVRMRQNGCCLADSRSGVLLMMTFVECRCPRAFKRLSFLAVTFLRVSLIQVDRVTAAERLRIDYSANAA